MPRHPVEVLHPLRPKKFFTTAISTSFLPSSCSNSAIRLSYSCTAEPLAKITGPLSRNCRFQIPTVLAWTPYALATWPGVLSSVSTSFGRAWVAARLHDSMSRLVKLAVQSIVEETLGEVADLFDRPGYYKRREEGRDVARVPDTWRAFPINDYGRAQPKGARELHK